MGPYIIAYDLGTGGNKSSLYDMDGKCCAESFIPYTTHYPEPGWHEQNPQDWSNAVVRSTRKLIDQSDATALTLQASISPEIRWVSSP